MNARGTVLHVTTTPISLQLLLGPQLQAFRAAGWRVVCASADGPEVSWLEAEGYEHHVLAHATRSMAPRDDALAMAELFRLIRRVAPDIVHTHNPKPGFYGRLAAAAARVPVVVNTVHGLYAQPTDSRRRRAVVYAMERLAACCSDAELVQNEEDLAQLARLRIPSDRLVLLGNGIDLERFDPARVPPDDVAALRTELGLGRDEVVAAVVGRLVWEKGYAEVFAAARRLRAEGTAVRWLVVGPSDPGKADHVDRDSMDAAARDGVQFLGFRDDMPELYAAADLFVLASHREGFPRAAMEASALGLPVVATDIRGCRQVVDPGVTGLLVPPRDGDALAGAVARLVADREQRSAMSGAARERALRHFDQRRVIELTLDTYERLLRGGRRAR